MLTMYIHFFCSMVQHGFGEGNGNSLQYSCLENPMDRGNTGGLQSRESQRVEHN